MAKDRKKTKKPKELNRFLFGLNSFLVVILAICLFGIVNYISYRNHARVDISRSQFYSLSQKTEKILSQIDNRIDAILYARPGRVGYHDMASLLEEYAAAQPHIRIARVDPDRDIARAEQIEKQYDIESSNVVIFDMGGKTRVVKEEDIVDLDKSPLKEGKAPRKVAFRGEQVFTSALQAIISDERPVVYFLQGHGEGDPMDYDAKTGYSDIAEAVSRDNVEVKTLTLGKAQAIPDDCAALVIAGPATPFSDEELALLDAYLDSNGSMLVMLESMRNVGLKPFLRKWSVDAGDEIVIDTTRTLTGRELFLTEYARHPITRNMAGASSIFYLPCPVEPIPRSGKEGDAADRPHATLLAASSAKGWAEKDWHQTPMEYNPETEQAGSLGVAVAAKRGLSSSIDVQIQPTRLVVFGDSGFVSNGGLAGANMNLFLAAIDWLLERDELIAIAPKEYRQSKLMLTRNQIIWMGIVLVFGLPLIAAAVGGLVWIVRRH